MIRARKRDLDLLPRVLAEKSDTHSQVRLVASDATNGYRVEHRESAGTSIV